MKLTAILLLIGTMHLSAASYSQSVSVSRKNTTLETVFKDIKQQTGYLFFYSGKVNLKKQTVNVELRNVPLEEALKACLADQNLTYNIVDKTIVIRNKPINQTSVLIQDNVIVSGKVVDAETQKGIPGVNITSKTIKAIRTQTDESGNFKLGTEAGDVLIFTYIGFKQKEVKVNTSGTITVMMETDVKTIDNVVITGYQTIKKESFTGNAVVIKGDDLKRTNPQNVLKAIQTFDPSFRLLDNNQAGSDPNALPKINVRGATALPGLPQNKNDVLDRNNLSSTYNLPAFIMDGFEVSLQKVVDLDINRIESITILKDAAATAVYGSRAANGVMVITTKAPVSGKLQLFYNAEMTLSAPDLSDYHVLNAKDKMAYEQMAGLYRTGGSNGTSNQDELDQQLFSKLKNVASGVDTYWLSQPLRNAYAQKHSLNVQGGDQSFRYGIDVRYQTQPGVMKGVTRDRFSGGMDFTYMPSRKLLFRNNLSINQTHGENSPYGSFSTYALMNPYYPKTDSAGRVVQELASWSINRGYNDPVKGQYRTAYVFNPLFEAGLNNFSKDSYLELIDAFSIDYKLSESFRLRSLISLNQTTSKSDNFLSPLSNAFYATEPDKLNNRGSYDYNNTNQFGIDGNVTLNYNKQIGDNAFNLVLGANVIARKSDFKSVSAQGFSNDNFTNIGFARIYKENSAPGGDVLINRTLGALFSGNYAFKNKYLADASFRLDGSSSFGSNKRFAPFWAAGLGWNIHNEDFLKNNNVISQLKLRANTGQVGSVGFEPYMSRSIYQYQTSNWYSTGIGATLLGYGNNNLQWQKTTTYDAGLDLGLLKDRLVISPRYYHKLTKGLITDITLSPSTGFTTYKENLGDMANKGFEVYMTANAYRNKDWNVNITGNAARNTNTLVKLSNSLQAFNNKINDIQNDPENNKEGEIGLASIPVVRYVEGQSLYTIYGVKSLGIDPENGKEIFVKKDGSLTYDYDIKDTQPIGDGTPKVSGNFGTNVSYKGFLVSFSLYYRLGGQTYNQTLVDRIENADPRFNVDSRALSQRWVNPGDHALYKNIADLTTTRVSSRFIQKENLVELQSVYLGYDFKKEFIRRAGFQGLRASITMNDIFRSSSVAIERGIDSPFARNVSFSLLASF